VNRQLDLGFERWPALTDKQAAWIEAQLDQALGLRFKVIRRGQEDNHVDTD